MTAPVSTQLAVRDAIRACTLCTLRQSATRPVPWSGPVPSAYLFVGMAPGRYEDEKGEPFIGRSGALLRTHIAQAGFPRDVAFANAVCCYPGSTGKGGDVKPVRTQLDSCRLHLKEQIALIQPRYIFLVGGTALEAFRPDLELTHVHGKPLYFDGTDWGFPITWNQGRIHLWTIYHPAAALRQKKYELALREDLSAFWVFRKGGHPWHDACYICGQEVAHCDHWGYMLCERHGMRQGTLYS